MQLKQSITGKWHWHVSLPHTAVIGRRKYVDKSGQTLFGFYLHSILPQPCPLISRPFDTEAEALAARGRQVMSMRKVNGTTYVSG